MYLTTTSETGGAFSVPASPGFVGGAGKSWTTVGWCRRTEDSGRGPWGIDGVFAMAVAGASTTQFRLSKTDNSRQDLGVGGFSPLNEWLLLAATYNHTTNTATIMSFSPTNTTGTEASATVTGTLGSPLVASGRGVQIGRRVVTTDLTFNYFGWQGQLGCIAIRPGVATFAEIKAMWDSKSMVAPVVMPVGGVSGINGDCWATLIGPAQQPFDGGVSLATVDRGARKGSTLTNKRGFVYHNETGQDFADSFYVCRPIENVQALTFESERADYGSFFAVEVPDVANAAVGNSPVAYRYAASDVSRNDTILIAANSRAVRTISFPAVGADPELIPDRWSCYFALGYASERLNIVKGFCLVRPTIETSARRPAFDIATSGCYRTGGVAEVGGAAGSDYADFCRWWTGSVRTNAGHIGNGQFLRVPSGDEVSMKAREVPGSLLTAARDWTMRVHYLRYPGGRNFSWEHREATAANLIGTAPGSAPSGSTSDADTTEITHTYNTALDSYNAGTRKLTLILTEIDLEKIVPGWAVCITAGTGATSMAEVESRSGSELTLRHAFNVSPADGATMKMGPVAFGVIEYTAPTTAAVLRGPVCTATDGVLDFIILAQDVIANGVTGTTLGAIGRSARGYDDQIAQESFNNFAKICAHADADGVWLHQAHQNSTPASYSNMADKVAAEVNCEILLLGDPEYNQRSRTGFTIPWGEYPVLQGGDIRYAGATTSGDPRIGSELERLADFQSQDAAHPSIEGHVIIARSYLDLFESEFENDAPPAPPTPLRLTRGRGGGSVSQKFIVRVQK